MPNVYKLTIGGLKKIIAEEKALILKDMAEGKMSGFGPMGDTGKKAKETTEVDADEHGTSKVHEKDVDQLKAQKIKEAKLLLQLKRLREQMRVTKQRIQETASAKKPRK